MKRMLAITLCAALMAVGLTSYLYAAGDDSFARERDQGEAQQNQGKDSLEGKAPPTISDAAGWMNTPEGKPLSWADLKGKVVLIDFWGQWCGPCRRAIPHLKELSAKHEADGLVVLGIHTPDGDKKGRQYVTDSDMKYPIAFDDNDEVIKRFYVDSYPDYYLVDHTGTLRFADLANREVDKAVAMLLDERKQALATD